jgi:hypothetical protein
MTTFSAGIAFIPFKMGQILDAIFIGFKLFSKL